MNPAVEPINHRPTASNTPMQTPASLAAALVGRAVPCAPPRSYGNRVAGGGQRTARPTHLSAFSSPQRSLCSPRFVALCSLFALLTLPAPLFAQRQVNFPPAEGKPPAAAKAPPKTQTGGEETDVIPDPGPTMRKTQEQIGRAHV